MRTACLFHYRGAGRIAICRDLPRPRPPGRGRLRRYPALAPPRSLLDAVKSGAMNRADFELVYQRTVLRQLDPVATWNELHTIADPSTSGYVDEPVLLCWEHLRGPDDYCHRRLVAAWFEQHLAPLTVDEIPCPETKRQARARLQGSLF